jgi:dTDP-4-amino-4,6-dideoxygalactose transaminase
MTQVRRALRSRPRPATEVGRLEAAAERVLGVPVIAFGSARSAIAAILLAVRPTTGRVVLAACTCVAVPNAIRSANLRSVWLDIDGPNIDPRLITEGVRPGDAVLVQHTYGVHVAPDVVAAARERGAFVIEDRAHRFDGASILSDAVVYSLAHSKVVSGGQGGLAWVSDPRLAVELRRIRDGAAPVTDAAAARILRTSAVQAGLAHLGGPTSRPVGLLRRLALRIPSISVPAQTDDELHGLGVEILGCQPELAAAAERAVASAPQTIDHRRSIGARYRARLCGQVPPWAAGDEALVRMPLVVEDAETTWATLRRAGWDLGPRWFNAPVHPRGSISDYPAGSAPNAERLVRTVLTLPTHPLISAEIADEISDAVAAAAST